MILWRGSKTGARDSRIARVFRVRYTCAVKPLKFPFSTLAITLLALSGCGQKPTAPAPPASAAQTDSAKTFAATAAHLDTGGDLYLYLRTEEVLGGLAREMDDWKDFLLQAAGADIPEPREKIEAWYQLVKRSVLDTGVANLRAFGLSGIELEPGLNRMRSMSYCGDVADRGLLWNLGGRPAPHPIAELDFLPDTTAYAAVMDFDPLVLWTFVEKVMKDIPDEQVRKQADMLPAMAQIWIGMTPKELFESIDSGISIVVTADESATMDIPIENRKITLPRSAAAVLIRVKNDKLYDLIVTKLEETIGPMMPITKSEKDGVRLAAIKVPDEGGGIPFKPVIARFGDYVAIASTNDLAMQLARKGPNLPPLMKDTPAFQRFAKLEKLEANSLVYLTERGSNILRTLQMSSFDAAALPPAYRPKIEQIYDLFSQKYIFSLGRIEKDGISSTMYSPGGSKQMIATVMVVPAAILAAIAVPAVSESLNVAKATQALAELRQIEETMKLFEADHNIAVGTVILPGDLEPYIPATSPLGKRLRTEPFADLLGNAYPELIAGSPPHIPAATAATYQKQTNRGFWGVYAPAE
jgi:type II secretory pathway pseudopilin PulG